EVRLEPVVYRRGLPGQGDPEPTHLDRPEIANVDGVGMYADVLYPLRHVIDDAHEWNRIALDQQSLGRLVEVGEKGDPDHEQHMVEAELSPKKPKQPERPKWEQREQGEARPEGAYVVEDPLHGLCQGPVTMSSSKISLAMRRPSTSTALVNVPKSTSVL